ncbi:MAG: histidine phosphatase family protein [Lautropia sp.]|nr:histidine phosphatase family protein [Lautropia sp.]
MGGAELETAEADRVGAADDEAERAMTGRRLDVARPVVAGPEVAGVLADAAAWAMPPAADEIRLTLVRHGETAWNMERRIQGQLDLPLNDTGLQQAEAAAGRFGPGMIDVLYTSDLMRAVSTAEPIGRAAGVAVQLDVCWRERHFGAFQGWRYQQIADEQPAVFARLDARDPAQDLSGGESLTQLMARVKAGLAALVSRHPGQRVVIVSHGGVLDCIYRVATGLPLTAPRSFPVYNASLNHLLWSDGRWQVMDWADIAHLTGSRDEIDPRERRSAMAGKVG